MHNNTYGVPFSTALHYFDISHDAAKPTSLVHAGWAEQAGEADSVKVGKTIVDARGEIYGRTLVCSNLVKLRSSTNMNLDQLRLALNIMQAGRAKFLMDVIGSVEKEFQQQDGLAASENLTCNVEKTRLTESFLETRTDAASP